MNVALRDSVMPLDESLAWAKRSEVCSTVTGDGVLAMSEIGVEMPWADAYAGLGLGTQSN